MIKIRLDSTTQHGARFAQEWTITDHDNTEHGVQTDSEWGDIDVQDGGDREFDVEGTPVSARTIVEAAISAALGPTQDGEEANIDAAWLEQARAFGCL